MGDSNLDAVKVERKTGGEHVHANGRELPYDVLGFWQWGGSDLLNNAWRGVLAEYLVACALGVTDGTRVEWDAYDMITKQGVKVEVKSAAYLQSWRQEKLSSISFNVQPTQAWDSRTGKYSTERKRQADVYVFAVLKHKDKLRVDPLDVEQWDFYVLPTAVLNEKIANQKQASFGRLRQLGPVKAGFGQLAQVIASMFSDPASSNDASHLSMKEAI